MMKNKYISLLALCGCLFHTACTCESLPEVMEDGAGKFALNVKAANIQADVTTRNGIVVNKNDFKVMLKDNQQIVLVNNKTLGTLNEGDRTLPAGTGYQISIESCTEQEALSLNEGWGQYRFTGAATFDITSGKTTPVTVDCKMQNAGLQVVFDNTFTTKFPIYAATTQDSRALVFKSDNLNAVAYYNVADVLKPSVKLNITGSAGGWEDRINLVRDIALTAGKIKTLTVKYDENTGSLDIQIGKDPNTETDENNDVVVQ